MKHEHLIKSTASGRSRCTYSTRQKPPRYGYYIISITFILFDHAMIESGDKLQYSFNLN